MPEQRVLSPPHWALPAGAALCAIGVVTFSALQYGIPSGFSNAWDVNPAGVDHFRRVLRIPSFHALTIQGFIWSCRLALVVAWIAYLAVLALGARTQVQHMRWPLQLVAALAVAVAVFCPPSLTSDPYAYVGYGRLGALHGLNPYLHPASELVSLGDPIIDYVEWDRPTVYGPVWTLLTYAVIGALRSADLWWQVVLMKLLAAVGLILTAWAARSIAEHFRPASGNVALLAVGLNPLFVIEGPANGHNDTLMVGLMLVGIALYLEGRHFGAFLLLGLSAGIKFATVAICPWLLIEWCRTERLPRCAVLGVLAAGLVVAPVVVGYGAVWLATDAAARSVSGASRQPAVATPPAASQPGASGGSRPAGPAGAGPIASAGLLIAYAALTVALYVRRAAGGYLRAWTAFGLLLALVPLGPVPWYHLWPCSTAFLRRERLDLLLAIVCLILGFEFSFAYTMFRPP